MQALLSILAFILPQALALYPAHHPPNCSTFAHDIDFTPYNATFLNATLYPPRTLNTSNILNNYTFCEIYAAINYSPNARLVFALWLPEPSQYQNRFLALGNGGYAGTIYYTDMMRQLNSGMGFAVASGNAGHSAYEETDGNNFGAPNEYIPFLHDDVSVEAWIHNAVSLFTPLARKLTEAYYARAPRYMYYSGCSTGGAQGFALPQYHPELFDGIFAGSPALSYTGVLFSFLWTAQHLSGPGRLSQAALNLTTNAVLDACDELDGVRDRMIENPLDCRFDIAKLTCGGTRDDSNDDQAQCLTPAQVQAAKAVYAGPSTSDTGEQIYPGFPLGSENQWYQIQESGGAANYTVPAFQNAVYDDLDWDPSSFNWTSAKVQHVMARLGPLIDQTSTNLTAFRLRSGKMLTTQGWADQYVPAAYPIQHLQELQDALPLGQDVSDFYNLFMVPGGGHCGSGQFYPQAPGSWHVMAPLVNWVERGVKPQSVLASDPADGSGRTRKLCPWPATARFVGGEEDQWTSYVCE